MTGKITKEDNKDKTFAFNSERKKRQNEDDFDGNKVDGEANEIENRINGLISQFDDGAKFDERGHKIIRSSTDIEEMKDKAEEFYIGNDIYKKENRSVEDDKYTGDIEDDIVEGKRKSSLIIYIIGGILIFLVMAIAITFVTPVSDLDTIKPPNTLTTYKINQPSIQHRAKKIILPKKKPIYREASSVDVNQDHKSSNYSITLKKQLVLKKEEAGKKITGNNEVGDSNKSGVPPETATKVHAASNSQNTSPYTIHIGSFRAKGNANLLVSKLRKEGILAFTSSVNIPGKGDWYRVFVSFYNTFEEAQNDALKLKKEKHFYINAVNRPYAIQVGLFDSNHELEKVESALWLKGYTPYSIPDRIEKGKNRLLVGVFESTKDAAAQIQKLRKEGFAATVVIR